MGLTSPAVHLEFTRRAGRPSARWGAFAACAAVSTSFAVVITLVLPLDRERYGTALRDVLAVARAGDPLPFYTGWGTYAAVVGLLGAAAVTALAGRLALARGERRRALLLGWFALVSAALAVDDLFMLHETLRSLVGVPEVVVMATWAVLLAAWALVFRRDLLRDADAPILALALVFSAHSAASDVVGSVVLHEEGTKLAAALCWAVWAWRTSARGAETST